MEKSRRVINATAPIRVCDLGGWTDTWFAETGAVFNIGVYPYAEVQIYVRETESASPHILIHAENYDERYAIDPKNIAYDRHPLLEASIDIMDLPDNLSLEINLYSRAPGGCSTGTSAAITTALLGALDLLSPGHRTPHEIARLAHRVETEKLGLQCGIQDQICSAHGGLCFIEMYQYPLAAVSSIQVSNPIWWELERRLVLIYLGKAHSSSEVHGRVIERLESKDADKSVLGPLRQAAVDGKNAVYTGDFAALGAAMVRNTDAQADLHPKLVSDEARAVIEAARKHGAVGWKVNGAGGEGGSLTILCDAEGEHKRKFIEAVPQIDPSFQVIPTYLSRMGLRRWEVNG